LADNREAIRIRRADDGAWVVSYGEDDERRYAFRAQAVHEAQEAAREDGRPVVLEFE
jgi:hypothetical protein